VTSAPCFSARELAEIVGRASNLTERLAGEVVSTGEDQVAAGHRLERWKQLAAKYAAGGWQDLLSEYGLAGASDQQLGNLLGGARQSAGSARPGWADFLQELSVAISTAFAHPDAFGPLPRAARRSIPFAALYWPIALLARQRVAAHAPGLARRRLGEEAWTALELHLLHRISAICSLALQPGFQAFAAVRNSGDASAFFAKEMRGGRGHPNVSVYRGFVAEQGEEGLTRFFLEYPVAARLVAQVTLAWIEFVLEFLQRLDADAGELAVRFFGGRPAGQILSCQAGISDPHRGGRSVLILQLAGGTAIVYKPRPLQIDAAFFDLLKWWNARSGQLPLRTLNVLARAEYGWENLAEPAPCSSRKGGQRFYRRAGALLCLLHALRGIDFHYENMIAAGDDPVVVDLEALCHPELPAPVLPDDGDAGGWAFDTSVLRTGMLPIRERCFGERRFLVRSALGAPSRQLSALSQVRWQRINSDAMEADRGLTRRNCSAHQPRFQGRPLALRQHLADVVDGFRRAANLLSGDSAIGREWDARVADMDQCQTRHIKRPTLLYAVLIRHSLEPRFLKDGVDRSIALQALAGLPADSVSRHAEIAALEALDIPYFSKMAGAPWERNTEIEGQIADIKASVEGRLTLEQGHVCRVEKIRRQVVCPPRVASGAMQPP
jgi:type 2 lantibiotic biosynthesis protein LanM